MHGLETAFARPSCSLTTRGLPMFPRRETSPAPSGLCHGPGPSEDWAESAGSVHLAGSVDSAARVAAAQSRVSGSRLKAAIAAMVFVFIVWFVGRFSFRVLILLLVLGWIQIARTRKRKMNGRIHVHWPETGMSVTSSLGYETRSDVPVAGLRHCSVSCFFVRTRRTGWSAPSGKCSPSSRVL